MAKVTEHVLGTFCRPELYTPDQGRAKGFHGGLFGWGMRELPIGPVSVCTFSSTGREMERGRDNRMDGA